MIKNFALTIFGLLSISASFAQSHLEELQQIADSEMKSAYAISRFTANENTGDYDVTYHNLHFTVNPANQFITGTVTTNFIAKDDMSSITFDLTNQLTVSSVTKNGNSVAFTQNNNDELIITFPTIQPEGTTGSVTINYSGVPPTDSDAFVSDEHNGTPIIWTLSQPYGAKDWWPCKQDLNDKIESIDVYITAPSQYVSVSNGVEQSQVVSGSNKTTHFHHGYPIPAYLVAIAVTNYTIYTQTAGTAPNTFPIVNYFYPENATTAQSQVAVTVPIMNFYEQTFGTYPFHEEKYGHAQCGFGGGMEHTTVSFMGSFGRNLIAHELGHQWFGDKITCGSWKDIWLNEGAATYLSGLVVEELDGAASFRDWRYWTIDNITSQPGGSVYLTDADTLNVSRIFSSRLSYNKGAMVFHMLRYKMGDANYFQALRNYLADNDLAYAKTPDLQSHLEAQSGMDLDEFFNDWVYRQGYPTYNITTTSGPGPATVTINQTQSHSSVTFFEMPVTVRFTSDSGATFDAVLDNTYNGQQFTVTLPFEAESVEFDPEHHIISRNNNITLKRDAVSPLAAIKLYPNPASALLSVEVPEGILVSKATFYNTLGQRVLEAAEGTSWNVSQLATGMHFVVLDTNAGSVQMKFIKE
ncbi:M1 family aminopeptidase [Flavobacterium sp. MFBS3-15]|uniref:M1 family aminopeptidase n=1 Tax=Flavobacterium sp. MFBS3-15 TaxID=2989816 RepID=UPI002235698F|nr:M1 family aminopeptidase [Flavobacterium sp. MFBS3-15]MCW4469253.1 M1 family aminopeptidase [Flavobacterium sp. MFBS3-15]